MYLKHSYNACTNSSVDQFVERNSMLWLDVMDGQGDHTYHNDVNMHYSLIDYFLTSPSLVSECQAVKKT